MVRKPAKMYRNLAKKAWIEAGEYDKLTEAARILVDIVKNAQ